MEITLTAHLFLVATAFFAGLISSIAGSGGILTLPALLWTGLPPLQALATNKVQSSLGTLSSAWNFFRKGHIDLQPILLPLVLAIIGSIIGTWAVQSMSADILTKLIPFLLLIIAIYFLLSKDINSGEIKNSRRPPRISRYWFACTAGLGMGFYGGFFGPGMGSIMPFLLVSLLGYNLVRATAETKLMILAVNGTSAIIFIINGLVFWSLAISMSAAQIIGARLGSTMVIKRGTALVQPLIIAVTIVVSLKLLLWP
jgi:uncharacterized membrane protein YfcA